MPTLPFSTREANRDEDKLQQSPNLLDNLPNLQPEYILGAMVASVLLAYRQFGRRIKNTEWITPQHTDKKRWIKGVVTSVGDADNFRLYHTPGFGYNWPFKFRKVPALPKDLKNETIHIRIAGIDAPEGAHFGKPGQLYYTEALEWLRKQILSKKVYCQLLRKDQYGRVVAHAHHPPVLLPGLLCYGRNIATEMLKAGWAVTYDQAGAEYGQLGKEELRERVYGEMAKSEIPLPLISDDMRKAASKQVRPNIHQGPYALVRKRAQGSPGFADGFDRVPWSLWVIFSGGCVFPGMACFLIEMLSRIQGDVYVEASKS